MARIGKFIGGEGGWNLKCKFFDVASISFWGLSPPPFFCAATAYVSVWLLKFLPAVSVMCRARRWISLDRRDDLYYRWRVLWSDKRQYHNNDYAITVIDFFFRIWTQPITALSTVIVVDRTTVYRDVSFATTKPAARWPRWRRPRYGANRSSRRRTRLRGAAPVVHGVKMISSVIAQTRYRV